MCNGVLPIWQAGRQIISKKVGIFHWRFNCIDLQAKLMMSCSIFRKNIKYVTHKKLFAFSLARGKRYIKVKGIKVRWISYRFGKSETGKKKK